MNSKVLKWLMRDGGHWGLAFIALWLFRDRIYFVFGRAPATPARGRASRSTQCTRTRR